MAVGPITGTIAAGFNAQNPTVGQRLDYVATLTNTGTTSATLQAIQVMLTPASVAVELIPPSLPIGSNLQILGSSGTLALSFSIVIKSPQKPYATGNAADTFVMTVQGVTVDGTSFVSAPLAVTPGLALDNSPVLPGGTLDFSKFQNSSGLALLTA